MADEKKYKEDRNMFDKEDEIKEKKPVVLNKSTKGKVAAIRIDQGYILVDVHGTGQRTPYIKERHSNLKVGDNIEF